MSLQRIAAAHHVEILRRCALAAVAFSGDGDGFGRGERWRGACGRRPARAATARATAGAVRCATARWRKGRSSPPGVRPSCRNAAAMVASVSPLRTRCVRGVIWPGVQLVRRQARRSAVPRSTSPRCRPAAAVGSRAAPGACRCRSVGRQAGFSARSCSRSTPERALERGQAHVRGHRDFAEFHARAGDRAGRSISPDSRRWSARPGTTGKKLRDAKPNVRLL